MKLLAFPCSRELAAPFLARLDTSRSAALILKKQEESLRDVLSSFGIREVYALPENFYGQVSSPETGQILAGIREKPFRQAFFPLNDFCGNVALLMAALVPQVAAINPTSKEPVQVSLPQADMAWTASPRIDDRHLSRALVCQVQSRIVHRLKAFAPAIQNLAHGDRAGERPTEGLVAGYPYDCEVLARYAYASQHLHGRVLEIGCGLGLGAYLLAVLNPSIHLRAVDNDPQVIALARKLWADCDRLTFEVGQAEKLPCPASSFEAVVCFEVIEHLSQPEWLLKEADRVLVSGGRLIGSTPNSRLFPYRVNQGPVSGSPSDSPDDLRQTGIWPWHLQELDEASTLALLERAGFGNLSVGYPTFTSGINAYNAMRRSAASMGGTSGREMIALLAGLKWSVSDFAVLDKYYPCFSGFSFIFSGEKVNKEMSLWTTMKKTGWSGWQPN
ncbi:MAG: class I SAM-dependent methyltransferase [bacterium]